MFAVTPWVPQLLLMCLLYLTLNRYFAVLMLCGLGYWYLRAEPSGGPADTDALADNSATAGDVDDATASAPAATDEAHEAPPNENASIRKAAEDKKDD